MNVFQKQLLLSDGRTLAERYNDGGGKIQLAPSPVKVSIEEFEGGARMNKDINITFGAMAKSIAVQLDDQGYRLPTVSMTLAFQSDADGLTRAYVRGYLTETEVRRARKRLMKAISAEVVAK